MIIDMPNMRRIICAGSNYEIGLKHGSEAAEQVAGSIEFYAGLFQKTAKLDWAAVREIAMQFHAAIEEKWPEYLKEMEGVAEGAGVSLADIIALNVRTEITFGLFSDGCTALSWLVQPSHNTHSRRPVSYLAQNWDWMEAQKPNLIYLHISQPVKPTIKMITEAGIIGKIGLNSLGVGVCLNAIVARGMDPTRIPVHLGLRMVLDSSSRREAVEKLERYGVASACHMLVADASGGVGLEWSSRDVKKVEMNGKGQVFHSNHYLCPHPGVEEVNWWKDSPFRVGRIEELAKQVGDEPSMEDVQGMFKDEENVPAAVCRKQEGESNAATLFSIVMELGERVANITLGRPVEPERRIDVEFSPLDPH